MKIHLIGICGTAMATLAAMLKRKGHDVRGSDQDVYPPMSDFLASEGIPTLAGYASDHIPSDLDLVVAVVGRPVVRDVGRRHAWCALRRRRGEDERERRKQRDE